LNPGWVGFGFGFCFGVLYCAIFYLLFRTDVTVRPSRKTELEEWREIELEKERMRALLPDLDEILDDEIEGLEP